MHSRRSHTPRVERRLGRIYITAFTGRFGFDILRISQIQTVRQKQGNVNALWDVYLYSSDWPLP